MLQACGLLGAAGVPDSAGRPGGANAVRCFVLSIQPNVVNRGGSAVECPKCKAKVGMMGHLLMVDTGAIDCIKCYICGYWVQSERGQGWRRQGDVLLTVTAL